MEYIYYLIITVVGVAWLILIFVTIIKIFESLSNSNNFTSNNDNITKVLYMPKKFLTNTEYNFLLKFISLENELHVHIVPQVNLAAIIEKKSDSRFNTELFRNIDFGIFSADYSKLLLLIELNDESHNNFHNNFHRKKRDIKVKDICNKAGIKLITFYTKYSNEKEYVKNRIKEELNIN